MIRQASASSRTSSALQQLHLCFALLLCHQFNKYPNVPQGAAVHVEDAPNTTAAGESMPSSACSLSLLTLVGGHISPIPPEWRMLSSSISLFMHKVADVPSL
jgi:hypothetical protein